MQLLTQGNTAQIYAYGNNLICKLFYAGYPIDYIEHEFDNAAMARDLGIRTPKAHEIVVENGRTGIVYDRVIGEDLYNKINKKSGVQWDMWMDRFVGLHKQLFQHRVDGMINYKDFLKMFTSDGETILKINSLADDNCFVHGDFHPGNVMLDESGNLVLIDMMNVCQGPVLYDIARTYLLLGHDANMQGEYLKRMGYTLENLAPYLDVLFAIRKNELNGSTAAHPSVRQIQ